MSRDLTRRDVLRASAAAAVGLAVAPAALASQKKPSEKIRFAMIGVGGRGGAHLEPAATFGEIVGLCDVDAQTRAKAMMNYPRAGSFADFRQMLETMDKHIDAVVVATPDHTHAVAAAMAMRMGKHVYCEKPLTRSIHEARQLAKIAKQAKVATQMGNQGTSTNDLRRAAAVIKNGGLGTVKEVHCWTNRAGGWWPQGVERPKSARCPKHVDFDLWLGPSPERPYAEGYHPFAWRGWWHFGCGALGDIGCHCMNLPFMALDLRDPIAIQAQTSGHNKDSFPAWSIVTYEFAARGNRPALKMFWYDGTKVPSPDLAPGIKYAENGCIIVGDKATLYTPGEYGSGGVLVGGAPMPDADFEQSPGHFAEWVAAMKGSKPARSNFPDYSCLLTEMVVLGNLAVWADGPRLEWDAKKMAVKGAPEYDVLIKPAFRSGWEL